MAFDVAPRRQAMLAFPIGTDFVMGKGALVAALTRDELGLTDGDEVESHGMFPAYQPVGVWLLFFATFQRGLLLARRYSPTRFAGVEWHIRPTFTWTDVACP